MNATCFGRGFGVLALFDSILKQALYVQAVRYETNALYLQAIRTLQAKGAVIQSIICNGRIGFIRLFPNIPMQLCVSSASSKSLPVISRATLKVRQRVSYALLPCI